MEETMIPVTSESQEIPMPVAPSEELPADSPTFLTTRIFDFLVTAFNTHIANLADEHYDLSFEDIMTTLRQHFVLHDSETLEILKLAFDNCVDEKDFRDTLEQELTIVE